MSLLIVREHRRDWILLGDRYAAQEYEHGTADNKMGAAPARVVNHSHLSCRRSDANSSAFQGGPTEYRVLARRAASTLTQFEEDSDQRSRPGTLRARLAPAM
jgi:hypothetical protein